MSLVSSILGEMSSLSTPHRKFIFSMLTAQSVFVGRANMTNLHRYGAPSPRTQFRWHHKAFREMDWTDFNLRLLEQTGRLGRVTAVAIDASFLPKAGKKTFGLGSFWDGCQDRSHKGLEMSLLALVEEGGERAWALNALQTPSNTGSIENRTAHYLGHLRSQRHRFPHTVRHVLADSAYANQGFVWGVLEMDLHLVTKLRKDANLRYLYQGPRAKRGRPRLYDGKVDYEDWSKWERLDGLGEDVEGYTAVVNHPRLDTNLRVVVVHKRGEPKKRRVLMSTDTELTGLQILALYASRFQIEFVFRDGKQFTGLADGQMRSRKGLHFHLNSSLATLNALRAEHIQNEGAKVISIASIKRRKHNEALLLNLFYQLGLDPTSDKFKTLIHELRNFGAIAA